MNILKKLSINRRKLLEIKVGDLIKVEEVYNKNNGYVKRGDICKVAYIKRYKVCSKGTICNILKQDKCILVRTLDKECDLYACEFKGRKVLK